MIKPEDMNPRVIYEYQMSIEEWKPKSDVTMKDVVVHGIVPECVGIANKAIVNSIYTVLSMYF